MNWDPTVISTCLDSHYLSSSDAALLANYSNKTVMRYYDDTYNNSTKWFQIKTESQAQTRSSVHNKLKHHLHTSISNRNSYFHCLPRLWNALPIFDINLSIATIKARLKAYMWNHFVDNFDDDNPCTYHYLCPCSKCHEHLPPANIHTL